MVGKWQSAFLLAALAFRCVLGDVKLWRTVRRGLPPSPVPVGELRWLTSAGATLAIVDLPGGEMPDVCAWPEGTLAERWLRPVHAQCKAAVLLYSATQHTRIASAPQWLEAANAFLLAAKSARRLHSFITIDVEGAVAWHINNTDWPYVPKRPVTLRPTSNVLVSLSPRGYEAAPRREVLEAMITFHALWSKHSCMRVILMREAAFGLWLRHYADILWRDAPGGQRGMLYAVPALRSAAQGDKLFERRKRNLEQLTLRIHMIRYGIRTQMYNLTQYGRKHYSFGSDIRFFRTLSTLFNFKMSKSVIVKYPVEGSEDDQPSLLRILLRNHHASANRLDVWSEAIDWIPFLEATVQPLHLYLVVPRAKYLSSWSILFRVLGWDVWGLLAVVGAVYSVSWRILTTRPMAECVFDTLNAFSSRGSLRQARTKVDCQRLQLAAALLASAVIVAAVYQGRLFTLMTRPERDTQIQSLEQLIEDKLPLLVTGRTQISWTETNSSLVDPRLQKALIPLLERYIEKPGILMERIRNNSYSEAFFTENVSKQLMELIYWEDFKNLYTIPQKIFTIFEGLHVNRNFYWRDQFNMAALRCEETGLYPQWRVEEMRDCVTAFVNARDGSVFTDKTIVASNQPKPFTFSDIAPHFQVLVIGCFLGVILFLRERLPNPFSFIVYRLRAFFV